MFLDTSVLYLFFGSSLLSKGKTIKKKNDGQENLTYSKYNYSTSINDNSMERLVRKDFLSSGSSFNLDLKEIIKKVVNNDIKSCLDGQYQLEKLCLLNEELYFKKLVLGLKEKDSTTNLLRLKIVNDWEYKVNNALIKYIQPYLKNNYEKLFKDINKRGRYADLILLILSFSSDNLSDSDFKRTRSGSERLNKSYKIISLMLSIIMRLLVINDDLGGGEIRKVKLTMLLSNNLISRAPRQLSGDLKVFQDYYEINVLNMTEDVKASVGTSLLDILLTNVDIIVEKDIFRKDKKRYNIISIKNEYRDELLRRSISPIMLPMIVEPLEWKIGYKNTVLSEGGYITSEMRSIINKEGIFIKQNFKHEYKSIVSNIQVDTINYLNKQKFRINKEMLEFLLIEFNKGVDSIIFKNKNRLHSLTDSLSTLDGNKDKDADLKKEILSHNSLYYLYRNVLELAIIFENITFYLPTFMDFRGRIYSYVHYLSYQGIDVAQSLFEFAEGCILNDTNIDVVYHYFANLAGKKRLTINSKIKWAKSFLNSALVKDKNKGLYTLENEEFFKLVKTSSDAALLVSVYFSLIKHMKDPSQSYHTPVLFDASCNGMQHLSALFSDIELGKLSNVIANEEEIPEDVYTEISNSVTDTISNLTDEDLRNKFKRINITRSLMKRPVMTIPYNVSLNSMQEQLVSDGFFIKVYESLIPHKGHNIYSYTINPELVINNDILKLNSSEMGKLSSILYLSVFKRIPSLQVFKKYLDDLINVLLKLDKPVIWTTPTGMTISLSNRKFIKYESKSLYLNKRGVTITLPTTSLDTRQIKRGFIPNFIHSMDASNIQLLVKRLIAKNEGVFNLYTIHDCFATTPDFMKTLNNEVKLAFIELYLNFDYLDIMHNNILSQVKSFTTIYTDTNINVDEGNDIYSTKTLEQEKLEGEYKKFIIVNNKKILIPEKPNLSDWNKSRDIFINGIKKSLYFIS
jgi:DNA-directed RNA polymerase